MSLWLLLSSPRSLNHLPLEIVLRIVEDLPPASLKQLRQTCKNLKVLIDPVLWHTVHLYPHLDHFQQRLALSSHPPVRDHVRKIVYDLRWASVLDRFVRRIESVYSSRVSKAKREAILRKARKARESTMIPDRDDDIELLILQDILRNLVSLESVVVVENRYTTTGQCTTDIDSLPAFYQRIRKATCGSLPDTDMDPGMYIFKGSTRSAKRVLVAAMHSLNIAGHRINSFEVYNAEWDYIVAFERASKHLGLLGPFIAGLKTLTLHAKFEGLLSPLFLMSNLGLVLELAANLENLDLSFGVTSGFHPAYNSDDGDWDTGDDSPFMPKSMLQLIDTGSDTGSHRVGIGLRRLALSEMRCSASELNKLLKNCAPTLKDLQLNHLYLLPEYFDPTNHELGYNFSERACFVRLFRDVRSILSLDSIWLSRRFSNYGRQLWKLCPEAIDDGVLADTALSTLEQLFQWILGADHDPLQQMAIQSGLPDMLCEQVVASKESLADQSFHIYQESSNLRNRGSFSESDPATSDFTLTEDDMSPLASSALDSETTSFGAPMSPNYPSSPPNYGLTGFNGLDDFDANEDVD